jgi:lysozyme family protein
MSFEKCLLVVLKHEGGYVNHPRDPGGMTNLGVTKRTWERWKGYKVTEADMRALKVPDVMPLYREEYWDALKCSSMAPAIALVLFDFGVNAGVNRAAKLLQGMIGATVDGHVGDKTLQALQQFATNSGVANVVKQYSHVRRSYYRSLPTFKTFGRGWLRRVDETEREALKMIGGT